MPAPVYWVLKVYLALIAVGSCALAVKKFWHIGTGGADGAGGNLDSADAARRSSDDNGEQEKEGTEDEPVTGTPSCAAAGAPAKSDWSFK